MAGIDETRVEILLGDIADALRDHYAGHQSPDKVYEALKALAGISATVILGTEGELLDWYLSALSQAMEQLRGTTKQRVLS